MHWSFMYLYAFHFLWLMIVLTGFSVNWGLDVEDEFYEHNKKLKFYLVSGIIQDYETLKDYSIGFLDNAENRGGNCGFYFYFLICSMVFLVVW